MNFTVTSRAKKALHRMDAVTRRRIVYAIQKIPEGDIAPLKGAPGSFRLRVGDWRVLYSCPDDVTIQIDKIAPRGSVYKGV
ncbi:MAG: type II toxin-antitoxin system RelE/ParE family toxin [Syntrophomonadaceae bacterium]|jgi:mRNA interferase RelE/StbE|nr:type II toxin-antitoxin system RelE/ParE family toxin [Syntrophomonadaceae bacterium]